MAGSCLAALFLCLQIGLVQRTAALRYDRRRPGDCIFFSVVENCV